MIGTLVGAGLSAVGNIFGGIAASKAAKKQKEKLESQKDENEAWYNRRYNEDPTQRADAQRLLTMTQDSLRRSNRAAAGTAAVMGSGAETVAAQQEANNRILAGTVSAISADAEERRDDIERHYLQRKDSLDTQLDDIEAARVRNIGAAAQGVAQVGSNLVGNFSRREEDSI